MLEENDLPIRIDNPRKSQDWTLPADRIALGEGYKPSLAQLPDGELVMVSLAFEGSVQEGNYVERTPIRRSDDGGKTWSEPQVIEDMIGRE